MLNLIMNDSLCPPTINARIASLSFKKRKKHEKLKHTRVIGSNYCMRRFIHWWIKVTKLKLHIKVLLWHKRERIRTWFHNDVFTTKSVLIKGQSQHTFSYSRNCSQGSWELSLFAKLTHCNSIRIRRNPQKNERFFTALCSYHKRECIRTLPIYRCRIYITYIYIYMCECAL